MTEQRQQPQPQPQPQPTPTAPATQPFRIPPTIPAIQNVAQYLAIGQGPDGKPTLYTFDLNLGQWGIASSQAMESIMIATGVSPELIRQLKITLPHYLAGVV